MSSKSSIQVCIKIRPCERGQTTLWQVKNGRTIQLIDSQSEPFQFDYVFDQDSTNQDVFDRMAKHIVHACVQGFNGTIFAYGQTSSGKTYTMMGDDHNPGVMVLAAKEIFKQIAHIIDREFLLRVGYIEIYNEKIYDLLNKKNHDLKIHEATNGVVSVNCEECIITSEEDLLQFLCMGNKERTVGETNMNERSSRSHAIFRIIIESRKADRSDDDAVKQSVFNLVDLAGSERADQTGARGARLKEGGHINKSLLFLSNVIKNLSENMEYINFRDSKLTRILQASLGGNALTSIICSIKPSIMEESQSTLNFAKCAKRIRIKPEVNEIVSDATMMKRLENEIRKLKDRLAEEERRNESKLKVEQLQQRIKSDMLKIISSNSLNDKRKQNRRRTWCPDTASPENGLPGTANARNIDSIMTRSQLPKPSIFPMFSGFKRDDFPKTVSIFKSLDIAEEEFTPGELINFSNEPANYQTPKAPQKILPALSLTPNVMQMGTKTLEMVEQDLMELQTYTNLEKQLDVKCDQSQALKEKLAIVSARRDELEAERLVYMQLENELSLVNKTQAECKLRCDALETEVSQLTTANNAANAKIEQFEQQVQQLQQTISKLELENREAVILEFEYQSLKSKSQNRESQLLSALSEKQSEIDELQKTLDELSKETLRNTKESRMRSMCPELNTSSEKACVKCVDLERLLEEHNKVKTDFEKLTLEYEKLQSNFQQLSQESSAAQMKLLDLEQLKNAEAAECEQLRGEISVMRAKLESVQHAYKQMSNNVAEKTDTCDRLEREVATAQNLMQQLQQRYDNLELTWQRQEQAIKDIQTDYDAIQQKYNSLQKKYESLEQTTANSEEQRQRLQDENGVLQQEIGQLKLRVELAQRKLMEVPDKLKSPRDTSTLQQLKAQNEQLKESLEQMQSKYDKLHSEYEDLSLQLMESVEEGDDLRQQCERLRNELKQLPLSVSCQQCSDADSLRSSGLGTECSESESDSDLQQQFAKYSLLLQEVELQQLAGDSRVFRATEAAVAGMPGFRLCLRSTQQVASHAYDEQAESDKSVRLRGMLKQHAFKIVELTQGHAVPQQPELLVYIEELKREIEEKNKLLDATEGEINEMREQMSNLECALLEKSVIVNKVEDYQRQIETLEKQNAEMTMVCEELQEKVKESTMTENESLLICIDNPTLGDKQSDALMQEIETLQALKSDLQANIYDLNVRVESQMLQIQTKDENIGKLQCDISELNEKCISMDIQRAELESNVKKQQQLLDRQTEKLASDATRIDKLQEFNAELTEREMKAKQTVDSLQQQLEQKLQENSQLHQNYETLETAKAELQQSAEQQQRLQLEYLNKLELSETALAQAKAELTLKQKECEDAQLEYLNKLELSESAYRENIRKYNLQWEESKDAYENDLAKLREQLSIAGEERQKLSAKGQSELQALQAAHDLKLKQLLKEKKELESMHDESKNLASQLQEKLSVADEERQKLNARYQEELQAVQAAHVLNLTQLLDEKQELATLHEESTKLANHLQEKLSVADDERQKLNARLEAELQALQAANDLKLKQLLEEKQELTMLHDESKRLANQLQTELSKKNEETRNADADLKVSNSQELSELQKKCEEQQRDYMQLKADCDISLEKLRFEKNALEATITADKSRLEALMQTLEQKNLENAEQAEAVAKEQKLREMLDAAVKELTSEKALAEEKLEMLNCKMNDLLEELTQAKQKSAAFEQLMQKYAETQRLLVAANAAKSQLSQQAEKLQAELLQAQQNANTQNIEMELLRSQLEAAQQAKAEASTELTKLLEKLQQLEAEMLAQSTKLQKQVSDSKSSLSELQLKLDSVLQHKLELQAMNEELAVKLKNALNVQNKRQDEQKLNSSLVEEVKQLTQSNAELQAQLKEKQDACVALQETAKKLQAEQTELQARLSAANSKSNEQIEKLSQKLKDQAEILQNELKNKEQTFRVERKQLDDTVACLLAEKVTLEEKLCTQDEILKKLETELTAYQRHKLHSNNNSFESNQSSSSAALRKSLDGHQPRKSGGFEADLRKSRRISTYDERRLQSYWSDCCDVGIMTDPVDKNCNCVELDRKLQDCQRNLFIRESQVTALNIELKNHPLKEENAQLKKRLNEEQEKKRTELKRFKQKNQELVSKINALTASAALTENTASDRPVEQARSAAMLVHVETQTESDFETAFKKLNDKFNDAMQVCRFRYNLIKELEEKVKQYEQGDASSISALTAGQISALKAQCEKHKKDFAMLNEKYESAKKVLKYRHTELNRLQERIAQYEAAAQ